MSITQEKIALAIIKGHISNLDIKDQRIVEECAAEIRELIFNYDDSGEYLESIQYGSLALALVNAEYAAEGVEGE